MESGAGPRNSLQFAAVFHRSPPKSTTVYPRQRVTLHARSGCLPWTEVGVRMLLAGGLQSTSLDMPTLSLVAVCIAGLLGLFLIIDWMQQRNVRALAWWGSAYLIGASAMALGNMPPSLIKIPLSAPGALTFLACGMVWNGVRLFQGRRVLPL